jgi:hypothetical protein
MPPAPRLNADFYWECPACRRPFPKPDQAAQCPCPRPERPPTVAAPLVRCSELPAFNEHPLALTGWLEADQVELTLLAPPGRWDAKNHPLPLLRLAPGPGAHRCFCPRARRLSPKRDRHPHPIRPAKHARIDPGGTRGTPHPVSPARQPEAPQRLPKQTRDRAGRTPGTPRAEPSFTRIFPEFFQSFPRTRVPQPAF